MPKVALLLLTRGALPHSAAWALWFAAAAGEVPLSALRTGGCSARAYADVAAACRADASAPSAVGNQHMFSVYVHTPPGFAGAARGGCQQMKGGGSEGGGSSGGGRRFQVVLLLIGAL